MVWCGVVWCGVVWCGVVWCVDAGVWLRFQTSCGGSSGVSCGEGCGGYEAFLGFEKLEVGRKLNVA